MALTNTPMTSGTPNQSGTGIITWSDGSTSLDLENNACARAASVCRRSVNVATCIRLQAAERAFTVCTILELIKGRLIPANRNDRSKTHIKHYIGVDARPGLYSTDRQLTRCGIVLSNLRIRHPAHDLDNVRRRDIQCDVVIGLGVLNGFSRRGRGLDGAPNAATKASYCLALSRNSRRSASVSAAAASPLSKMNVLTVWPSTKASRNS